MAFSLNSLSLHNTPSLALWKKKNNTEIFDWLFLRWKWVLSFLSWKCFVWLLLYRKTKTNKTELKWEKNKNKSNRFAQYGSKWWECHQLLFSLTAFLSPSISQIFRIQCDFSSPFELQEKRTKNKNKYRKLNEENENALKRTQQKWDANKCCWKTYK